MRERWMRRALLLVFVITVAIISIHRFVAPNSPALNAKPGSDTRPKKLIEWGWDEPTTTYMRENIEQAETLPFDGFVLPMRLRDGTNATWKMWAAEKMDYAGLDYMVDDLTKTPFKRLTDRFIRVNVTPGNVRWTDEEAWSGVLHNFGVAAKLAKATGCKGFMFDPEKYEEGPFSAAFVNANDAATQAAYRQLIRQRGRELISAIAQEFPDIVIIFTIAYYSSETDVKTYTYLRDLLDGMFEATQAAVRLVDGWEHGYSYKTSKDYLWGYDTMRSSPARVSDIPGIATNKMEAGFGVWIDNTYSNKTWRTDNYSGNFFTPAEFETSIKSLSPQATNMSGCIPKSSIGGNKRMFLLSILKPSGEREIQNRACGSFTRNRWRLEYRSKTCRQTIHAKSA